jgi:hypothetical protein
MAETPLDPSSHTKKEVREVLEMILARREPDTNEVWWRLVVAGHWGHLRCKHGCCDIVVDGTPSVPARHARDLDRRTKRCPLQDGDPRSKRRQEK